MSRIKQRLEKLERHSQTAGLFLVENQDEPGTYLDFAGNRYEVLPEDATLIVIQYVKKEQIS